MSSYPHLLEPLAVGPVTLRNRMVMGAMHTRLETMDRPGERLGAFFATRAQGEIGLILTGGFSPNAEGRIEEGSPVLDDSSDLSQHQLICSAVHAAGGMIALQMLHAGRYAKHSLAVGPSDRRARINPIAPRRLSTGEVWETVSDFARTAELARQAGYDGVEIMGSEGYLINEFTAEATNDRDDEFGGSFEERSRLPVEIVKAVRARAGSDFLLIYRISSIDLVEGGLTGTEVAELARRVEAAVPTSSTPASAGTNRRCRPSRPACRGPAGASRWPTSKPRCRSRSSRPTGSTTRTSPRTCSPGAWPT